jgi:hypothetical protein
MKNLKAQFSNVLITLILANAGIAHSLTMDGDILLAPRAEQPPAIDGEMDKMWYNVTAIPAYKYIDNGDPYWLDLFSFWRIMWDDENIYFFVTVFDDVLDTHHNDMWQKDCLEIYFDGDNSKNDLETGYDENDFQFRWTLWDDHSNQGAPNAVNAFQTNDFGYTFEVAIPVADLAFDFEAGHEFGFDLQVNDNDGGNREHANKWWSEDNNSWLDASLFGTVQLTARVVSEILDMNYTDTAPSIDGELDAIWMEQSQISNNEYYWAGIDYYQYSDWDDCIFNFRTMWDEDNFYLFAEVQDNERNTSAGDSWVNDSFEIYFDGDNEKRDDYDADVTHWRYVYNRSTIDDGPSNTEHSWIDTDAGYNFELRVPAEDLTFNLEEGHIFGFELQLNDNDRGIREKIGKWWSGSDDTWLHPYLFGTAKLIKEFSASSLRIKLISPTTNHEMDYGEKIQLNTSVTIETGSIDRVEFYSSQVKIGEVNVTPYNFEWQPDAVGNYYVYAVVYDDQDNNAKSNSVHIIVNEDPNLEMSEPPLFSIERGFFDEPFDVLISSQPEGGIIKYTLDGSDPKYSETALSASSPGTVRVDPESDIGQRGLTAGFVIRARAQTEGFKLSNVVAQTYVFIDKVVELSPDWKSPGGNWPGPTRSGQWIDYGMDPDITNDSRYRDLIDDALLDIPTICLSTNLDNIFGADSGIYTHADKHGKNWERPASVELINPDGSDGFEINAGVRIRGGWSRHPDNPKHAFRLFFRKEYGKGKLEYPLFGEEGTDSYDKVDLRTSQNYSWSYKDYTGHFNTMNRDVYSRDLSREMGQPYTRSRYYHLYINGYYWGIFQTQERAEARFAESYFGGSKEDYDVIKVNINDNYNVTGVEATDGYLNSWEDVWNLTRQGFSSNNRYFRIQGLNSAGQPSSNYKKLVDVENLIDYMLIIFYTGNYDTPTNVWSNNGQPKNFFCIYNRNANDGYKFFMHDAEHTLNTVSGIGPGTVGLHENRVNIGFLNNNMRMTCNNFAYFHPQWLHFKLAENDEFVMLMADHIYKHFFNDGCFTPERAEEIFMSTANQLDMAIIAESARWGDSKQHPPRNKHDDWLWAIEDLKVNYFPYRTDIVIDQLKEVGWYPDIDPPFFKDGNVEIKDEAIKVEAGFTLNISNSNGSLGSIYYTTDGSDPRLIGGDIASSAIDGGDNGNVKIEGTTVLKSRIKYNSTWSASHEIVLSVEADYSDLKITEIHYHPLDGEGINNGEYEFLELKNIGTSSLNLTECYFSRGLEYVFPAKITLNPNEFFVLASNMIEFKNRYKFEASDEFEGQLDNGGETLELLSAAGDTIFSIRYNDKEPWPVSAGGGGYSIVPKDPNPRNDLTNPDNWRASYNIHGSPGKDDDVNSLIAGKETSQLNEFQLFQNYPNPFNPVTYISFVLPEISDIKISIFDVNGRIVEIINKNKLQAGYHTIFWNASNLPSGTYFIKFRTKNFINIQKCVLLK